MSAYDVTPLAAFKEYESLRQSESWLSLNEALKQRCVQTHARYDHWHRRKTALFEEANNLWQDHYFHAIEAEAFETRYPRLIHLMQRADGNSGVAFDHFVAALMKACAALEAAKPRLNDFNAQEAI